MTKIGYSDNGTSDRENSARKNPHCSKCGTELEYIPIPIFGDYALGTSGGFWRCPNCGRREEVQHG